MLCLPWLNSGSSSNRPKLSHQFVPLQLRSVGRTREDASADKAEESAAGQAVEGGQAIGARSNRMVFLKMVRWTPFGWYWKGHDIEPV